MFIELIKKDILQYFVDIFQDANFSQQLNLQHKDDRSIVTRIDYDISNLIKDVLGKDEKYKSFLFLSEEDQTDLGFPTVVLDPIDGTKELSRAIGECAVSLALMESPAIRPFTQSFSWIFNPFTGFEAHSGMVLPKFRSRFSGEISGLVSRTEWDKGLYSGYQSFTSDIILSPRGSIAFKLGLCAKGACDFIVSLRPKHIWDIAAGTLLCGQSGIAFYEQGKRVDDLLKWEYSPPLIWCYPEDYSRIEALLKKL